MNASEAARTGLRQIPIAHPLVLAGSLGTLGLLIYWSLRTDLRQPGLWIAIPVCALITAVCERSRRRSGRSTTPAISRTPVLGLED